MAFGVVLEFPGVTQAQYEALTKNILERRGNKPADWPECHTHMAGPMPGGWRVVDAWESEEAFVRFGESVKPLFAEHGFPEAPPKIFPLVRFGSDWR